MPITHTLTKSYATDGMTVFNRTINKSGSGSASFNDVISGPAATDVLVDIAFPFATIKAVGIEASADCTLETNSGSAADDTISLTANVPLCWDDTDSADNPFTADVTKIYVTHAEEGDVTLKIGVLYDATPA